MGKHGPCYHCGVTSTPLWRNGPPEKPILCNACGSRWRTKGSLVNYTPLHARAEPDEYDNYKIPKAKIMVIKTSEPKALKRKQNHEKIVFKKIAPNHNYGSLKNVEKDTSNKSSSGSVISNVSESCVHYSGVDVSELSGPSQSVVWEQTVPSKKRTCFNRPNQSPLEKLTKDLYTILHEQQFSHFSESSEEDLLFENDRSMVSVEIGHGSVLIRHPSSIAQEEESEASSISVENKAILINESYSGSLTFPLRVNEVGIENNKRAFGLGMQQEVNNSEKDEHEKLLILENHNSPLCCIDLKGLKFPSLKRRRKEKGRIFFLYCSELSLTQLPPTHTHTCTHYHHHRLQQNKEMKNELLFDHFPYFLQEIINYEVFASHMTSEEQQLLLELLPVLDKATLPESLQEMFSSLKFEENMRSFQKLLSEGIFDFSISGAKAEDCRTIKKLALSNSEKSTWIEKYSLLKDNDDKSNKNGFVAREGANLLAYGSSTNIKKSRDVHFRSSSGTNSTMKTPIFNNRIKNGGSFFPPRNLFSMANTFQYMTENTEQDLLLDVPNNNCFPEAELFYQNSPSSSSVYPRFTDPSKAF